MLIGVGVAVAAVVVAIIVLIAIKRRSVATARHRTAPKASGNSRFDTMDAGVFYESPAKVAAKSPRVDAPASHASDDGSVFEI